ncbi:hypothetical protein [Alkalihalobacillus sp. CinArs1]|uniref:hypothetical protein n=1 Tax=Alkalihalobacillus sp. CinArs1 TaxID=2995314 RepID=UPI0022DE0F5A|nr:hypothetical protein [Alkalihalobacillus sp. CinArs1]
MLKFLKKLLPSLNEKFLSRFKLYRRLRGGVWYKVSDRVVPKHSLWVREVDHEAYYVWKKENYNKTGN